jgi:hypothetical protein
MSAPTPLSPEEVEKLPPGLSDAELAIAAHGLLKQRNKFAAEIADLSRQLAEARADLERLTRERNIAKSSSDYWHEAAKLTHERAVIAERERDEAYATIRRVWQALGCERYEDARGMHISELVDELRRDRDRHAERARCLQIVLAHEEGAVCGLDAVSILCSIADEITGEHEPTLPEESGDRDHYKALVDAEREAIAAEARRYASHYPQGSDGRNTFILLAEWIERRAAPTLPEESGDG